MKVILIQESRFADLLDLLKLRAHEEKQDGGKAERLGISKQAYAEIVDEAYRSINYALCRWMRDEGASSVRY